MRFLLDTHVLLKMLDSREGMLNDLIGPIASPSLFVSVASLWEIAIKVRQGKLGLSVSLADLEGEIGRVGCTVLPIGGAHVVADVTPWPSTNDPFDRLLLAVCAVEQLRLLTWDRALVRHPLAWRA